MRQDGGYLLAETDGDHEQHDSTEDAADDNAHNHHSQQPYTVTHTAVPPPWQTVGEHISKQEGNGRRKFR